VTYRGTTVIEHVELAVSVVIECGAAYGVDQWRSQKFSMEGVRVEAP